MGLNQRWLTKAKLFFHVANPHSWLSDWGRVFAPWMPMPGIGIGYGQTRGIKIKRGRYRSRPLQHMREMKHCFGCPENICGHGNRAGISHEGAARVFDITACRIQVWRYQTGMIIYHWEPIWQLPENVRYDQRSPDGWTVVTKRPFIILPSGTPPFCADAIKWSVRFLTIGMKKTLIGSPPLMAISCTKSILGIWPRQIRPTGCPRYSRLKPYQHLKKCFFWGFKADIDWLISSQ